MAQDNKHSPKYITQKQVTDYAGVSTKTVSRVVNHQGELSEATRERVQAAINKVVMQASSFDRRSFVLRR